MKNKPFEKIRIALLLLCLSTTHSYAQGIISTRAGNGIIGYYGDNGKADTCHFNNPFAISLDTAGNIYISDGNNFRVRKITKTTNVITTIAGNGVDTFSADGVSAATTGINPDGIFADAAGNVFIADVKNNRIRKVDAVTGIISTVAGNGKMGYSGDTGLAINEKLYWPTDVCTDTAGNIYIADYGNNRVRKVTAATGKISTVAGNSSAGYSGDGAAATSAMLNAPTYVCTDKQGNIYISDVNNNVIRKVDVATGIINTVAGNDTAGFSGDGGLAVNAKLLSPAGIYVSKKGDLYIADEYNDRIRKVSSGYISTIAGGGTGTTIGDGNLSTNALLSSPTGIYIDTSGALYIADMSHQRIRYVAKPSAVTILPAIAFSIYPNPSTGIFTIQINDAIKKYAVEIHDMVGTLVYQSEITNNKLQVALPNVNSGLYFIVLRTGEIKAIEKLVICL
jgi:sugar lactone lactonase YvrE